MTAVLLSPSTHRTQKGPIRPVLPTSEGIRLRNDHGRFSRTDGPFTETKDVVGGYAMLKADSMEEALELTRRFLAVHGEEWNLECEVRQLDDM